MYADPKLDCTFDCLKCGRFTPRLVRLILDSDLNNKKNDETPLRTALKVWRAAELKQDRVLNAVEDYDPTKAEAEVVVATIALRREADKLSKQ